MPYSNTMPITEERIQIAEQLQTQNFIRPEHLAVWQLFHQGDSYTTIVLKIHVNKGVVWRWIHQVEHLINQIQNGETPTLEDCPIWDPPYHIGPQSISTARTGKSTQKFSFIRANPDKK